MNDREIGTLRELNVQPGDVVEYVSGSRSAKHYAGTTWRCLDRHPKGHTEKTCVYYEKGSENGYIPADNDTWQFRIISRATPALPFGHARLPSGAVVDLTAITTPFGLLDEVYGPGAQEALRAHGGPWEGWCEGAKWEKIHDPYWSVTSTYRVKPQPPAPVVKTVTLLTGAVYNWVAEPENECGDRNTHRITFDLIDGDPDCDSIRMVAL